MARMYALLSVIASFFVVFSAAAGPIDPHNPPMGRFADDWMEIHMLGGKVGYGHSTMSRDGDKIRTAMTMRMRIGRAAQPVEISVTSGTTETLSGKPISFYSETSASIIKTTTKGTIKDGKVTLVFSQFGDIETTYDFEAGSVMTWGQFREGLLRGFEEGTTYTQRVYSPDLRPDASMDAVTTVAGMETIEIAGRRLKARKVTVTMTTRIGPMSLVSYVDTEGSPIKSVMPIAGIGDIVMYRCDEEKALREFVPPEFFVSSVIRAGRSIDTGRARRIKYRITALSQDVQLDDLPTTGMQTPASPDGRSVVLVIRRQPYRALTDGSRDGANPARSQPVGPAGSEPDMSEYLSSNLMMNIEDAELIKLAARAAGGEREPFALADRLRRFVTDYITDKTLDIGFATAGEVCRTREGDCSEHGVLLAALGRIHKLPSRVVVGLAYVPRLGEARDVFGYHMWTQFFIDERWIDYDAALRETDCSPTHIAFAVSSLKEAGLADLSLPLIHKIGGIAIEILDIDE